jgi:hypothetical protein
MLLSHNTASELLPAGTSEHRNKQAAGAMHSKVTRPFACNFLSSSFAFCRAIALLPCTKGTPQTCFNGAASVGSTGAASRQPANQPAHDT